MSRKNNEAVLRWQKANRPAMRKIDARYTAKLHEQLLAHYGRRCADCGTDRKLWVTGWDGSPAVPSLTGRTAWRHLRDQGWPPGFVMRCQRCTSRARRARLASPAR